MSTLEELAREGEERLKKEKRKAKKADKAGARNKSAWRRLKGLVNSSMAGGLLVYLSLFVFIGGVGGIYMALLGGVTSFPLAWSLAMLGGGAVMLGAGLLICRQASLQLGVWKASLPFEITPNYQQFLGTQFSTGGKNASYSTITVKVRLENDLERKLLQNAVRGLNQRKVEAEAEEKTLKITGQFSSGAAFHGFFRKVVDRILLQAHGANPVRWVQLNNNWESDLSDLD